MSHIRWDCRELAIGCGELREAQSRMSALAEEIGRTARRLDPQLEGYDELGRSLCALCEGVGEGDARRLGDECAAMESAIEAYGNAERAALRASESLPAGIVERGLVLEDWFAELMR